MHQINKFIQNFTKEKFEIIKIKDKFFLKNKFLSKYKTNVLAMGVFLGENKKNKFIPSLNLISILAQKSKKKVWINDKAEWLFICGRDVLPESIIKHNTSDGLILVQNQANENLGIGEFKKQDGKKIIKNILDIGDYMRREK